MADAIVLEGLTKTFGSNIAVRDLDLVVPEGALYGFIGPNGAGKTTTIRMIMSILFPDRGKLSVLGHPSALDAKDRIGYLPEERGLYKKMKVGAFLRYVARLKGRSGPEVRRAVREWLERVALADVENKRCEELSKGMQQKIQFIAAVIHDPELLILDEPFSGLDPVNMRLLRDLVLEQSRRGATVIFSTHVMVQAEQICEHIVMIHDGLKVLDDSLPHIQARFDPRTILLEPLKPDPGADPISSISDVRGVRQSNGVYEVSLQDGSDPTAVMRRILESVPASRIELRRPTLEDIFVEIVKQESGSESGSDRLRESVRDATVTGLPS